MNTAQLAVAVAVAKLSATTPSTGVVNFTALGEGFYDLEGSDPQYEAAMLEAATARMIDNEELSNFADEFGIDYHAEMLLVGDWKQDTDTGEWNPDPALPKHGFAAIHNVEKYTVQIVASKWYSMGAAASPSYPNQVDLETAGNSMAYALPHEMYDSRDHDIAIIEFGSGADHSQDEEENRTPRFSDKVKGILQEDGKLPAFAWPGGYPIFYVTDQNDVLCPACANKEDMSDTIVDYDVNYEDVLLCCADCGEYIDPAYITGEELLEKRMNPE